MSYNLNQAVDNLEYHQQETSYYCGAACAQMVLHQIGVPHTLNPCQDTATIYDCTNNTDLCQRCLYEESRNSSNHRTETWFSYPDGLTATLNNHRPPIFAQRFSFVLFENLSKAFISQKLCWTIINYKVAPIVLSGKNGLNLHWIVVKGYDSPTNPQSANDTSFNVNSITGFWVHDPWPNPNAPLPPPPHTTDDVCGRGIVGGYNRAEANQHIDIEEWNNEILIPVVSGNWAGKYLAICDPDKGPEKIKEIVRKRKLLPGNRIMSRQKAIRFAMIALKSRKIIEKDFIPVQVKKATGGKPLLVQKIDSKNEFYYIIPLIGANGKCYGRVMIDARYGNYLRSTFPSKQGYLEDIKPLSKTEILKILGDEIQINKNKKIKVFPQIVNTKSLLVWLHCKESLSPFYPFQEVTVGEQRLYIRIDKAGNKIFYPKLSTQ